MASTDSYQSTGGVWNGWVDTYHSTATTSVTTTDSTWGYWCSATDDSTCVTTSYTVWSYWVQERDGCVREVREVREVRQAVRSSAIPYDREPTTEEKEAQRKRDEEYREKCRKENEERLIAEEKAKKLLLENIDEENRKRYEKDKLIIVTAKKSNRVYQIKHGRSGNVVQLDAKNKPIKRFCMHPIAMVPDADTVLAQKLMLEHNEDEFLRLANVHQLN